MKRYSLYLDRPNHIFTFGKHINQLLRDIALIEGDYILWCIENLEGFCIDNDSAKLLEHYSGLKFPLAVLLKNIDKNNLFDSQQSKIYQEEDYDDNIYNQTKSFYDELRDFGIDPEIDLDRG